MPACARCGVTENLEQHHTVYRSNGGNDNGENIEILCRRCHVALHRERGDFEAWGRGDAAEVLRRRGEEGRAFLAEIGRRGGLALRDRYGRRHLQRIGRRGGKTTLRRHGVEHMRKIGRKAQAARRAKDE